MCLKLFTFVALSGNYFFLLLLKDFVNFFVTNNKKGKTSESLLLIRKNWKRGKLFNGYSSIKTFQIPTRTYLTYYFSAESLHFNYVFYYVKFTDHDTF